MLTIKITFGGGDAQVSRSYQAKAGKVRPIQPPSAGLSVQPPDPPIRKAPPRTANRCGRAAVSALPVHLTGHGRHGQELGADPFDQGRQPSSQLRD